MKKKYFAGAVLLLAIFLNLVIPACGSNNNSNPSALGLYSCLPGQSCTGVSGTPMFPGAISTSVDSYGSTAQMMIYGSNYTAGQNNYTGSVSIQMQVNIAPNGYGCPPGSYMVTGTGSFQANYGGTYGLIQAQLTGTNGFSVQLYGEIFGGQNPYQSQPTQYYYMGNIGNSCDPNAKAL